MEKPVFGLFNVLFSFSSASVKEGDDISDLILWKNQQGATTVNDFKGQWLVLYFYPKANTPGCTKEALTFNELLPDFHETNAEVIGVSTDSENKHEQFREKQDLNLKFISDPEGKLAKTFGIKIVLGACMRDTVLIDPKGKVDTINRGVNPKANPQEMLRYIQNENLKRQTKTT